MKTTAFFEIIGLILLAALSVTSRCGYAIERVNRVFESGKEGHGGTALFCEPSSKAPKGRKEMLDIYEAETELKLNVDRKLGGVEAYLKRAFERVEKADRTAYEGISMAFYELRKQVNSWVVGDRPMMTSDYISLFPGERCRRMQVGNRKAGRLTLNHEVLNELSVVSQAAFWMHEAIYEWMSKKYKISTSDVPRVVTGLLFAEENRIKDIREFLTAVDLSEIAKRWIGYRSAALREMLTVDMMNVDTSNAGWGVPRLIEVSEDAVRLHVKVSLSYVNKEASEDSACAGATLQILDADGAPVGNLIDEDEKTIMLCMGEKREIDFEVSDPKSLEGKTLALVSGRGSRHAKASTIELEFSVLEETPSTVAPVELQRETIKSQTSPGPVTLDVRKYMFRSYGFR